MEGRAGADRGLRVKLLTALRYNLYRASHFGREPWDWMRGQTERYSRVGTATRCKVCGLSIRGALGWLNRALWGVAILPDHPDLCNV